MNARLFVNTISMSRILLGLCFLIAFKPIESLWFLSLLLCALFFLTDIADGFFARKLKVASIQGRQWDSLGDKSFYMAVLIAFVESNLLITFIAWGLIVREIALYILRVLYIEKLPQLEEIRFYTNWHGYFMYILIALGLWQMHITINNINQNLFIWIQLSALLSLIFGIGSIMKFISLKPKASQ